MKKIVLLLSGTILFAGTLKLLNVPANSDIIIGKTKVNIGNKNNFTKTLKDDSYDILIKNNNFLPIHINDVSVDSKKPTIITLNEETQKGVQYPVIPINKYYKTIAIYYDKVTPNAVYKEVSYCDSSDAKCVVTINKSFFSKDKVYSDKYKSNLYVFPSNLNDVDVNIKVSSPYFYSTSTSTTSSKDENFNFYPTPKWSFLRLEAGMFLGNGDITLTNDDNSNDTKTVSGTSYFGFKLGVALEKNLPYIDMYVTTGISGYLGFRLDSENSDGSTTYSSDGDNSGDVYGASAHVGIGHLFKTRMPIAIETGLQKNYLTYTIQSTDYYGNETDYTYKNEDTEPYVSLRIGMIRITVSKSIIGLNSAIYF